jgi:hypothetical protein
MLPGNHRQLRITDPPSQRQSSSEWLQFFYPCGGRCEAASGHGTNPAPKKAVPIKVTAAIKLAGAEVIEDAPEICPEELAEQISRAMASVRAWK